MTNKDAEEEVLTAAECARRTGLTVRALRVYEDHGLVAPRRTPGGWRCYGTAELVRLNTIGLLKTAGLTLSQIRALLSQDDRAPSLQHVLETQIETWQQRRCAAELGQAVAEAALRSLQTHDSLSIDELCKLVRSLAMNDQTPDAPPPGAQPPVVTLDPAILDRYVGQYQFDEFTICSVTRHDEQLFMQVVPGPRAQICPESPTEFVGAISGAHYSFLMDADGVVTGVCIQSEGPARTLLRLDAAASDEIRSRLAARIQSNVPIRGSEAALRRTIEGLLTGAPNYEEMSPGLAQFFRKDLLRLQTLARYLGAIRRIEFKGVGRRGWDIYDVERENGSAEWRIAFKGGIITGATARLADGP